MIPAGGDAFRGSSRRPEAAVAAAPAGATRLARLAAHPHLPAALAAALGAAYLLAAPATADLAAQAFRVGLWEREGFAVFNLQWYGGHHVPGYSLLYPPLAAALGIRVVGVAASIAAVALFAVLAREHAPPRAAQAGALWFALGAATNVVVGRMPFALGVALGLAALLAAERRRRLWALALAAGCVLASPVAGAFLALAGAAWTLGRGGATGIALAGAALGAGGVLVALFPEGGTEAFAPHTFWHMLAACAAAQALLPGRRPALRAGIALYALVLVAAFALPTPMGQNAARLGAVFGGPILACAAWNRGPRLALGALAASLLYAQWLPAVRAVAESRGDPSARAAYFAPLLSFLDQAARPGERVEIPFTRNHWEAAHVASRHPLARGWERQLDRKVNALFYRREPLTAAAYRRWLRASGVHWVALPDVPLDFSARREAALLRRGLPFLERAFASRHWRVWRVRRAPPPASGAARIVAADADELVLAAERPGRVLLRTRFTPYWTLPPGRGCVRRGPGGWTVVDLHGAGRARLTTTFAPWRALRRGPRCGEGWSAAADGK